MKRRVLVSVIVLLLLVYVVCPEVSANSAPPKPGEEYRVGPGVVFWYTILSIIGLCITLVCETVTAVIMKIRPIELVVKTNIKSQLWMHITYLILMFFFSILVYKYRIYFVIFLEVIIYIREFMTYKKNIKDISTKKILLYAIIANTLSLTAGALALNF